MRYFVAKKPAIIQQDKDYPYYVSIVGLSSIHNWRAPAQKLKIKNLGEYVQFLKERYDVSIRLNWGPHYQRLLGLHVDFKHQSDAENLVKLCNEER